MNLAESAPDRHGSVRVLVTVLSPAAIGWGGTGFCARGAG